MPDKKFFNESIHVVLKAFAAALFVVSYCVNSNVVMGQQGYEFPSQISIDMAPGVCADACRATNPELTYYQQPVRVSVPDGATIGVTGQFGSFVETASSRVTVGMFLGPVYRFKVAQIPRRPETALYPSIEILGKLNPPAGLEGQFPIEVIISQDDLEQAIEGKMISKVIYLENAELALPHRHVDNDQPFFDVNGREDPLRVAKRLGRPIAILRLGSRVPTFTPDDAGFGFNAPAPAILPNPAPIQDQIPKNSDGVDKVGGANRIPTRPGNSNQYSQASHRSIVPGSRNDFVIREQAVPVEQKILPPSITDPVQPVAGCNTVPFNPNSQSDEYVFDGNDRNQRVQVDANWKIYGLDTEDTVVHFDTLDGRRIACPSNRVAIYAPRFGAVRKLEALINAQQNDFVGAMEEKTMITQRESSSFSTTAKQHLALDGFDGAKRASGLINRTRGVLNDNVTRLFGVRNSYKAYENLSLVRIGRHSKSESARLNVGMESAKVWEDDLGLQVAVAKVQPIIVKDIKIVEEIAVAESELGPDCLRVCKLASRIAARAGETVEFTIRFDNLSGRKVGNVTIIDNLTRRLEYVPDTAECSLKAKMITSENDGGSLMLRWEIEEPMAPGTGGIIRFTCKVR